MRGKKQDVCHTCRRHKIGCDGRQPTCSQCQLTGRECVYLQELVVFHHKPASRRPKKEVITEANLEQRDAHPRIPEKHSPSRLVSLDLHFQWLTYAECVAILVRHYIPKDEIPFLSHVEPSKSRICGGWVQALPHVSQDHVDFERIVSPAVRTLTISMMVTGMSRRQEYLDAYGHAIQGIRSVLDKTTDLIGSTVAIAGMCLALSEVLVPTSNDGYKTHLRGVAAMMQSRGPCAFRNGVAHLMFVGVRPLIVLDSILRRKTTFLMDEQWRTIPFSTYHPSPMQVLLGHATSISALLEAMGKEDVDLRFIETGLLEVFHKLQGWEDAFLSAEAVYQMVAPDHLDLSIDSRLLPQLCFDFSNVSHANSLTHCWAFRIVCLLQLWELESQIPKTSDMNRIFTLEHDRRASISILCTLICQGLPYILQKEMSLYGSMSAEFPLHMVSESLQTLQLQDCGQAGWCKAIKEQILSQRTSLYEEMAGSGVST